MAEVLEYDHHRREVRDVLEKTPAAVHDLGLVDIADHDGVVDAFALESTPP